MDKQPFPQLHIPYTNRHLQKQYKRDKRTRIDTMEDRANQARGHKATLSNPNVSKEAKQHSREVLRDEFGNQTSYKDEMEENKDKTRV